MNEKDVQRLIDEIDSVEFREFWWGSSLLDRCMQTKDPRVIEKLCVRHHCLQNKQADSCHVIRNTIKAMDGPSFTVLWQLVESEPDQRRLIESVDDPYSLPWASAFVLGEIGGREALSRTTGKLAASSTPYLWVRLAMHLIVRYMQIPSEDEPQIEEMDMKTGKVERFAAKERYPDVYERQMLRRRQANEYFTPVDPRMVAYLKSRLSRIPEAYFPLPKAQLVQYCGYLPKEG